MSSDPPTSDRQGKARFDTTQWSAVIAAGRQMTRQAEAALETLCQVYWYPLYAYARRRVADVHQAQDLTQQFFAVLLEKNYLADAREERGRFRWFLLASFKHFLAHEAEKQRAQKRGGGLRKWSLDFDTGDARYRIEPVDQATPEKLYDREWARQLTQRVLSLLGEECRTSGKEVLFETLNSQLIGDPDARSCAPAAAALGMTPGAVRVALYRLRSRYAQLLRSEIAQTVSDPEMIEDEIRSLFRAFSE